jgi:hypothetical protein
MLLAFPERAEFQRKYTELKLELFEVLTESNIEPIYTDTESSKEYKEI